MFKTNPKQLVVNKCHQLYGKQVKVLVQGRRPTHSECHESHVPTGTYAVGVSVNGMPIAAAHHHNWRRAYKLLTIEVEKTYEATLTTVQTSPTQG